MARITRVQKAQQRYAQVPVLNEDGTQKFTPVLRKDGTPKTTKRGREVQMRVTVSDKSQPLPNRTCERCSAEILVGTPYKHVTPKSGPYGGRTRYRCASCPDWEIWDLSSSLSARIAQIQHDLTSEGVNSDDDEDTITERLNEAAESIRELAGEKEEAANNMEDGFGHETEKSAELREQAEALEDWASEVENASIPDKPEEPADGEPGEEPDDHDSDDWRDWEQTRDEWDEYENELEQWQADCDSTLSDAAEAVSL